MAATRFHLALVLLISIHCVSLVVVECGIGVNWGTLSTHKLPPVVVVDLLRENKIEKVKLFDSDPDVLRALMGSGIQVMVGVPNEMLGVLGTSPAAADLFVSQNVSRYLIKGGADIRYVGFGFQIFSYGLCWIFVGSVGF